MKVNFYDVSLYYCDLKNINLLGVKFNDSCIDNIDLGDYLL